MNTADVPVFILCGGLGTRIKEETEFRPKPMVPIGEHPILWHVMRVYARHGFRRFVLCLGFKADVVKDYFRDFHLHNADCTIKLKSNEVTVHEHRQNLDWEVTLAYTGEKNMTGSRVAQAARKYLGAAETLCRDLRRWPDGRKSRGGISAASRREKNRHRSRQSTRRRASVKSKSKAAACWNLPRNRTSKTIGSTAATFSSIAIF